MTSAMDRFCEIPLKDREQYSLYCNEKLAEYFNKITHRLIDSNPRLKKMYEEHPIPWVIMESDTVVTAGAYLGEPPYYFYISRALINLLDNEDQLAYLMGHELEHFFQEMVAQESQKKHRNSQFEESTADWNATQRLAAGGYNIDEGPRMCDKLRQLEEAARAEGDESAAAMYKEFLRTLDPHPRVGVRTTINEAAAIVANRSLAAGIGGKQGVNADAIAVTPLSPEIYKTDYIAYVDKIFADAHFEEMSVEEKNEFLIDMLIKNSQDEIQGRRWDVERKIVAHIGKLKEDMEKWSAAEKEARFADGTAPAMHLIERYVDKAVLNLDVSLWNNPDAYQSLEAGYRSAFTEVFDLWPSSVHFPKNSVVWQKLRYEIQACLERGQKRARDWSKMTDEEREKAKAADEKDSLFIQRLNKIFLSSVLVKVGPLTQQWVERYTEPNIGRWADLPRWEGLHEGDKVPDAWLSVGDLDVSKTPVNFEDWVLHKAINRQILDEYYHRFIVNSDGSICACKVIERYPRVISDTIDKTWANETEFLQWQEETIKDKIYQDLVEQLRFRKKEADEYIAGKNNGQGDEIFGEFPALFLPALPKDLVKQPRCIRGLELEDVSDVAPDWKYEPRAWIELENYAWKLDPFKLDRELLKSKMTPEEVEFFTNQQKEYADKLVDALIARIALKTPQKELDKPYWPFPPLESGCDWMPSSIHMGFFPDQAEKIAKAYTEKAPATEENALENGRNFADLYKSLYAFYCLKRQTSADPKYTGEGVDFSDFQTVLPEYILKCFKLPEFSYENVSEWEKFVNSCPAHTDRWAPEEKGRRKIPLSIQVAVTDAVVHNKGERIPLQLINDLLVKVPHGFGFGIYIDQQMKLLCQNKENWPESLADFSDVVHCFSQAGWIGSDDTYKIAKECFIDRLRKEADPKKILESWCSVGDFFSLMAPDAKDYDASLVPLLVNSPIWNGDLKFKIASFKKIPEYMWGSDCRVRDNLAAKLLDEIETIKDAQVREATLFEFVQKDGRFANAELLDRVQHMWVKSVADIMGKEDNDSPEYFEKIKPYIDKIKKEAKRANQEEERQEVLAADKQNILKYLAEEVVSQKNLSRELKPKAFSLENESDWEKAKDSLIIIGAGWLEMYLHEHPERRDDLIDFLRSKGTVEDCRKLQLALIPEIDNPESNLPNSLKYEMSVSRIQRQHKAFWSADPIKQCLIVDAILKDTTKAEPTQMPLWKQNFSYVAEQMFPAKSPQSKALITALEAYIESRPRGQNLLLAKLLISAGMKSDNMSEEEANQKIGQGIKMFLESIGPAGIKLGQALAAVPDIPSYIRDNLQNFTSNVDRPTRWEIYDWLDKYKEQNPNESELIDHLKLGKILGAASFFVTLDSGNDEVIKILRQGAKVEAIQEMGYISETLDKLSKNGSVILGDLGPTLQRIVKQAEDSIAVETDLDIGEEQFKAAKELYPENVEVGDIVFNVKEAEWKQPHGDKWAKLEKMHGVEVDKIKDPKYKKAASIAYFSIELLNIFSGGKFDFDRHVGQMKIDQKTNTLGLFDTGSMLLEEPTIEDQKALGTILYRTLENAIEKSGAKNFESAALAKSFAPALTEEIDRFYKKSKQPSSYMTQVQRGLLALSGYYKDFSFSDFMQCVDIAFNNPQVPVSQHIMSAFVSEMLKKTGLFKTKAADDSVPEEVAARKEKLGNLIFNLFAAAQKPGKTRSLGDLVAAEYERQKEKQDLPVLGKLFVKKKQMNYKEMSFKNTKIPACFGSHIVAALREQQIDPIVAKGIMKEAFASLCLIDKNKQDSPKSKRELGKQLYGIFCLARQKGQSLDKLMPQVCDKLGALSGDCVMARNLLAVLSLAKYMASDEKIDLKEIVWEILSQKGMDRDVVKGIQAAMKEQGQSLASLALHFRKPLSTIRKIRRVFSLFKKNPAEPVPQKVGLRELLERAQAKLMDLPQNVSIEQTDGGTVLRLLTDLSKDTAIPLAKKNTAIRYGKKRGGRKGR